MTTADFHDNFVDHPVRSDEIYTEWAPNHLVEYTMIALGALFVVFAVVFALLNA